MAVMQDYVTRVLSLTLHVKVIIIDNPRTKKHAELLSIQSTCTYSFYACVGLSVAYSP